MMMATIKKDELQRLRAAEEVCWQVILLMGIGELDQIPMNLRPLLATKMQVWSDMAYCQGILGDPENEASTTTVLTSKTTGRQWSVAVDQSGQFVLVNEIEESDEPSEAIVK